MTEQEKINKTMHKFGHWLLDYGITSIRNAYKLKPVVFSRQALSLFLSDQLGLPASTISLADEKYHIETWTKWGEIIDFDLIDQQIYLADTRDCKVPDDLAFAYGLFFADGSCSLNKDGKYAGAGWRIVNSNKDYLERAKLGLDWEYNDSLTFEIKEYPSYRKGNKTNFGERKKTLYCLEAKPKRIGKKGGRGHSYPINNQGKRGKFIKEWRGYLYDTISSFKIVPKPLHDKYPEPKRAFLEGVIAGDGTQKKTRSGRGAITVNRKNKRAVGELVGLMYALDWYIKVSFDEKQFTIHYNPLKKYGKWRKRPEPPEWGCDNFASLYSARASMIYGLNSCALAYGNIYDARTKKFLFRHAFNIIISHGNGALKLYLYEPQTDEAVSWIKGQDNALQRLGWVYRPDWLLIQ